MVTAGRQVEPLAYLERRGQPWRNGGGAEWSIQSAFWGGDQRLILRLPLSFQGLLVVSWWSVGGQHSLGLFNSPYFSPTPTSTPDFHCTCPLLAVTPNPCLPMTLGSVKHGCQRSSIEGSRMLMHFTQPPPDAASEAVTTRGFLHRAY